LKKVSGYRYQQITCLKPYTLVGGASFKPNQ
jgi:hypothetical protein